MITSTSRLTTSRPSTGRPTTMATEDEPAGLVDPAPPPVAAPPGGTRAIPAVENRKGLRTVTEPHPLPHIPVPADQAGIEALRLEINEIDASLVQLIQRRTAISHAIGAARQTLGGTRIVYSREMAVLDKFRALGSAGTDLGMLLLSMGRGPLGRK